MTAFTYHRRRKEFGGLKSDQMKRLKNLEKENERLRKPVICKRWTIEPAKFMLNPLHQMPGLNIP